MSDITERINLPCDDDGYTPFQCPHCKEYFKLNNNELEGGEIIELFCPICGLSSSGDNYITEEVIEHAKALAQNIFADVLNKGFKDIERGTKGFFKVTNKIRKEAVPQLYDHENESVIIKFDCCAKTAKILLIDEDTAYCPYCGVN